MLVQPEIAMVKHSAKIEQDFKQDYRYGGDPKGQNRRSFDCIGKYNLKWMESPRRSDIEFGV